MEAARRSATLTLSGAIDVDPSRKVRMGASVVCLRQTTSKFGGEVGFEHAVTAQRARHPRARNLPGEVGES